jgi:hypothetical protein
MITYLLKYVTKLLANLDVDGDQKFTWADVDKVLKWVLAEAEKAKTGLEKAAAVAALFNKEWAGRATWVVDGIVKFVFLLAKVQKLIA